MVYYLTGPYPGETEADHRETAAFIRRNAAGIKAVGAMNTCDLLTGTWLWGNRATVFTRCDEGCLMRWELDGLTWEVRRRRFAELARMLTELAIPVQMNNQADLYRKQR